MMSSSEKVNELNYFKQNHLTMTKIVEVRVKFHLALDTFERCPYCNKLLNEGDEVTKVKVRSSNRISNLPISFHSDCLIKVMKSDKQDSPDRTPREIKKVRTPMREVQRCPESLLD